jgi:hypothetical protein
VSKPRHIIVTAANDLYLPLARGMLSSLRALRFSAVFDIGVIDVGLNDEAKSELSSIFGATIVPARADFDYPGREAWECDHPAFRSLTSRPYLRDYFPGYETYMLFDADAWAQTPDAVDTMLQGAASDDAIYIASEMDRDYKPYFLSSQPFEYHLKWFSANFAADVVRGFFPRPMLNAGIWAMNSASPVWNAWAHFYRESLNRTQNMTREQFMVDQLSLNVAIYTQGLPVKVMPAEYNWLSLFTMPMWDAEQKLFIRPTVPRTPISILHLTHEGKLKNFDLQTTQGDTINRSLMYPI